VKARRLGLVLAAAGLGLTPLLLGAYLQARGRAASQAVTRLIQARDVPVPAKVSAGPHLPKGCWLRLEAGRPSRWMVLVQRESSGRARLPGTPAETVLKPVKRLRPGRADWILKGQAPAPSIPWPELAQARRVISLEATGYDPGPVDNTRGWVGSTRSGERARFGIVAVDPRLIPLGTRVYVEGYGPGLAADVGGAIKGRRIDLCFNSTHQANAWGRRKVRVWIVDPVPRRERDAFRSSLNGA
jgi:3D (Asp-Asp-Asp) domain-containing protein